MTHAVEESRAEKLANQVIKFEKQLQQITSNEKYNHNIHEDSAIDWSAYRKAAKLTAHNLYEGNKRYFEQLGQLVLSTPREVIATYFKSRFLSSFRTSLPVALRFLIIESVTGRKPVRTPNRKFECLRDTKKWLGFLLSKFYVERSFSKDSMKMAQTMVHQILRSFAAMLQRSDWLDEKTRERAIQKVKNMKVAIAGPKKWPTYDSLEMTADNFIVNTYRARLFEYYRNIVNPSEHVSAWEDLPLTINAYNQITPNAFVLPAGILHPPIFDHVYSDPVNFGR